MKKNANWKVYRIHQGKVYHVDDHRKVHRVDLTTRSCTCRKWQLSGIPCGHVVAVGRVMGCNDCSDMALAHAAWVKGSKEIARLMLMTMELDIQRNLENLGAYEMLQELKTLFSQQAEQKLLQTMQEFHTCKHEEGQSVSSYVLKMKSYIVNLERLGYPVSLGLGGLRGSRKLKPSALSLYVGNGQHATIEAIGSYHLSLPSGLVIVLNNCHYDPSITRGIISVSRLYDDGYVNSFVENSIQVSRNNMVYFSAIPKDAEQKLLQTMQEFHTCKHEEGQSVSSYVLKMKSYIVNLECLGYPVSLGLGGLRGSRKLKPSALSLYVGNGQHATVEAIGSYHLSLPRGLVIVLNNCHYDPSITRGIISVFRLYDDGYVNSFVDNSIQVSRNNMVYFSAIPNDGYPKETMGLCFCYPSKNKVLVSWNAEFLENSLITQEASGSLEDLKIIQEEDTQLSIDTSLNHKKDDLEINEPQSDIIPICRSTKTRLAPDRMCLYIDDEEHELGDLGEPACYKAALLDPESDKWLNAMNVEMQSMKDNEVWDLVDLPPNGKIVGSKWLFKKKTDMDEVVHTYKARLVAKGYTQTSWIDYEDTFSPVANIRAIMILIAIAAFYDYEIWKMDVKTAFLNGYLSKEVYIEKPKGFVNLKYPNRLCKLKRSIYELKQASREWNKRFDDEIKKFGFTQNRDEPCVYLKASGSNVTFLILYVDDILIMRNNIPMLQDVKSYLGRCFAMKDLDEAAYILGIKIYRDRSRRLIGDLHWTTAKNILKYLGNTNDMFLVYGGDIKRELRVSCYIDAGYLTDVDDLNS
nr:retrotransposon protein, putative, Ty1-copia subclass [Tanacetum cinerariifolium]